MLLEAIISLLLFSLILSLFLFKKPTPLTPTFLQNIQPSHSHSLKLTSKNIQLDAKMGIGVVGDERYMYFEEVK